MVMWISLSLFFFSSFQLLLEAGRCEKILHLWYCSQCDSIKWRQGEAKKIKSLKAQARALSLKVAERSEEEKQAGLGSAAWVCLDLARTQGEKKLSWTRDCELGFNLGSCSNGSAPKDANRLETGKWYSYWLLKTCRYLAWKQRFLLSLSLSLILIPMWFHIAPAGGIIALEVGVTVDLCTQA